MLHWSCSDVGNGGGAKGKVVTCDVAKNQRRGFSLRREIKFEKIQKNNI